MNTTATLIAMGFQEISVRKHKHLIGTFKAPNGNVYAITTTGLAYINKNGCRWTINKRTGSNYDKLSESELIDLVLSHNGSKVSTTNSIPNPQISAMPNFTKQQLVDTVKDLIGKNGTTTTLDVKESLRAQGLRADQNPVSSMMNELADENVLSFVHTSTNGNQHKVYSLYVASPTAPAPSQMTNPGNNEAISLINSITGIHRSAIGMTSRLVEDLGIDNSMYQKIEAEFFVQTNKSLTTSKTVSDIQDQF